MAKIKKNRIAVRIAKSFTELKSLTRVALIVIFSLSIIGIMYGYLTNGSLSLVSIGFLIGSLASIINLLLIGKSVAPLIHGVGNAVSAAMVFSLSFGLLAMLATVFVLFFPKILIGFAFGLASPMIFGLVYALLNFNSE